MSKTLRCRVITPEKILHDVEATYVSWPTWDGQRGSISGTSPLVAKLGIGVLVIKTVDSGTLKMLIHGGVGEMGIAGLSIITDEAEPVDKIDPEQARKLLENAKNDVAVGVVDREMKEKEYNLALARVAAIK